MDETQRHRLPSIQIVRGGLVIFCLGIGILVSMAIATTPPADISGSSFLGVPFSAYMVVGIFQLCCLARQLFTHWIVCDAHNVIGWCCPYRALLHAESAVSS